MPWSSQSVESAVKTAKANKAVFVVYVEDEAKNTSLDAAIQSSDICNLLREDDFVAIKVQNGSRTFQQFTEIYQIVPVPSLFFIGNNGWPLEIITRDMSEADIKRRIIEVLNRIRPPVPFSTASLLARETQVSSVSSSTRPGTSRLLTAFEEENMNSSATVKPASEEKKVPEVSDKPSSSKAEDDSVQASPTHPPDRASPPVEVQPPKEPSEKIPKESSKENPPRTVTSKVSGASSLGVSSSIHFTSDVSNSTESIGSVSSSMLCTSGTSSSVTSTGSSKISGNKNLPASDTARRAEVAPTTANIQFRLPDGSLQTHSFSISATLREVRHYVQSSIRLPFRNFDLATTFPRHEFTADENDSTVTDLGLVPRCVLLILPVSMDVSQPSYFQLLWSIIARPFALVYNFVFGRVFGDTNQQQGGNRPTTAQDQGSDQQPRSLGSSNTSQPRGRVLQSTTVIKREGNIFRLSNRQEDSDDDNNTWNGNSTQQM